MTALPIGGFVEVGGRRLFGHRSGAGGPAVVFIAGAAAVGLDYLNIHDRAAGFTTSVLYDRGGTGWSDPMALPRSAADVATELRALLRAMGVPGPYVLVGHSLGGLHARRFAQLFPEEVAGLLLLDPAHEDYFDHMPEPLRSQSPPKEETVPVLTAEQIAGFRAMLHHKLAEWPDAIREPLVDHHLDPAVFLVGARERQNLMELFEEVRHGGPVPDVPMIVFTAMGVDPGQALFLSPELLRQMNDGKRRLYSKLAASFPRGEHRVLEGAGHSFVHMERPDAVLAGVQDLVARARE